MAYFTTQQGYFFLCSDDPETCSIRKLLLKMEVKDTQKIDGFTLADLHGFILKATEQAK